MNLFYQLASQAETFVIKNFNRMNIHEFVSVSLFYLHHEAAMSRLLLENVLAKIEDSVTEFNEF
jgi:hypothetical protein